MLQRQHLYFVSDVFLWELFSMAAYAVKVTFAASQAKDWLSEIVFFLTIFFSDIHKKISQKPIWALLWTKHLGVLVVPIVSPSSAGASHGAVISAGAWWWCPAGWTVRVTWAVRGFFCTVCAWTVRVTWAVAFISRCLGSTCGVWVKSGGKKKLG